MNVKMRAPQALKLISITRHPSHVRVYADKFNIYKPNIHARTQLHIYFDRDEFVHARPPPPPYDHNHILKLKIYICMN